jgi:hypothetical protein
MEHLCPAALTTTLPSIPKTCNNPIGWHHTTVTFHLPHSSLYKLRIGSTCLVVHGWQVKKILLARILIDVTKHGLMRDKQFQFQPKHSMSLSLVRLTEKITRNSGEKRLTSVVFLDVAKAFDIVWIDDLLNLPSYLVKTASKNHTSGVVRSKCPSRRPRHLIVACGLGWHRVVWFPVLFSLYVNDMPTPSHHVELIKQTKGLQLTLCASLLPHLPLISRSYAMTLANK